MTIFTTNATPQNVDRRQIGTAQHSMYRSTGSKLLDSLNQNNSFSNTTVLFGANTAHGLGLQHLEIPSLVSTSTATRYSNQAVEPQMAQKRTARESAVSRVANIIKQDRSSIARG